MVQLRASISKRVSVSKSRLVRRYGSLLNKLRKSERASIREVQIPLQPDCQQVSICCLGTVENLPDVDSLEEALFSAKAAAGEADVYIAPYLFAHAGEHAAGAACLDACRILHQPGKAAVESVMLRSDAGDIGVVFYSRYFDEARRLKIRAELYSRLLALKDMGASYTILCVVNNESKRTSEREKTLYRDAVRLGFDYVLGSKPSRINSGRTYLCKNRIVRRSVYALGSLVADGRPSGHMSVALHLCLRRAQDRLSLLQESMSPLFSKDGRSFKNLDVKPASLDNEEEKDLLASVLKRFKRVRRKSEMLTLGKVLEVTNTPVPERYSDLVDYSIGRICARSFEVKPGDIFFLREAFNDPNDDEVRTEEEADRLVRRAVRRGAFAVISYREIQEDCPCFINNNVVEAHIALIAYLRKQLDTQFVAITGSVGKTSTKDMLYEVLSMQYRTEKSEHNGNVQVNIAQHVQDVPYGCEMYLQEVGGGRPGGASRHSRMVLPQAAVVTNIGDAHIGNFHGSHEALMANKLHIADGMAPEEGVLFLNYDDPLLCTAKVDFPVVSFAVHSRQADYYAENVAYGANSASFDVVHCGSRTPVVLNVLGEHNVLNAVCAFAVGRHFGIAPDVIAEGLSHFETKGIRQSMYSICGRRLLMDCFNASSKSMLSSLEMLQGMPVGDGGKKIAIIGDITGAGELAEDIHRELADALLEMPPDEIILFGEDVQYTHSTLASKGVSSFWTSDREELNRKLMHDTHPGDAVLLKGSSKMSLEYSVDLVFGTRFADQRHLDEKKCRRLTQDDIRYNVFKTHATAVDYKKKKSGRNVRIPAEIRSVETTAIASAFGGSCITEVRMPDSVLHVGTGAFKGCGQLKTVRFSKRLKLISDDAFAQCSSLEKVKLPDGVMHIGDGAFRDCSSLRQVVLPRSVVQIGDTAFDGCTDLVIKCSEGSYAMDYARKHSIRYEVL